MRRLFSLCAVTWAFDDGFSDLRNRLGELQRSVAAQQATNDAALARDRDREAAARDRDASARRRAPAPEPAPLPGWLPPVLTGLRAWRQSEAAYRECSGKAETDKSIWKMKDHLHDVVFATRDAYRAVTRGAVQEISRLSQRLQRYGYFLWDEDGRLRDAVRRQAAEEERSARKEIRDIEQRWRGRVYTAAKAKELGEAVVAGLEKSILAAVAKLNVDLTENRNRAESAANATLAKANKILSDAKAEKLRMVNQAQKTAETIEKAVQELLTSGKKLETACKARWTSTTTTTTQRPYKFEPPTPPTTRMPSWVDRQRKKDLEERRRDIRNRVSDIIDGLFYGPSSAFRSFSFR